MKKITNINDLRFNLTNYMRDLIIEIIIINQMLKENNLNDKEIVSFLDIKNTHSYFYIG